MGYVTTRYTFLTSPLYKRQYFSKIEFMIKTLVEFNRLAASNRLHTFLPENDNEPLY